MAGYNGYSMSNNAVSAYKDGEKPLSKWTKGNIIEEIINYVYNEEVKVKFDIDLLVKVPLSVLKEEVLYKSSWHHTSSMYNKTYFYSIDTNVIEELTNENINEWLKEYNKQKNIKKKDTVTEETWECEYLIWEGSRKHPKAHAVTDIGIIKGNWFFLKDGTRKSINANGFHKIKQIVE